MGTNNLLLEEAQKYFKLQRQEELSKLKERIPIVDATSTIALPIHINKTTHEMIIVHNNVDL